MADGLPQYERPAAFAVGSDWMQQFTGGGQEEEMPGDESSEEEGVERHPQTR